MSKIVKNISDKKLAIPNVGEVEAGETIEVSDGFHNANFEDVTKKDKTKEKSEENIKPQIK